MVVGFCLLVSTLGSHRLLGYLNPVLTSYPALLKTTGIIWLLFRLVFHMGFLTVHLPADLKLAALLPQPPRRLLGF